MNYCGLKNIISICNIDIVLAEHYIYTQTIVEATLIINPHIKYNEPQ